MGSDPFLSAWGAGVSWKGGQHQARLLSGLDVGLVNDAPERCWRLTWAVGQCESLVEEALVQSEVLLGQFRQAPLYRGLSALRSSRRGPQWWRRYWFKRAMGLAPLVEDAQEAIAQANQRLVHWHQAVALALEALERERQETWPSHVSVGRRWKIDEATSAAVSNLSSVRAHLELQLQAGQRLEVKATRFLALAAGVPDEQSDPLSSVWVQAARAKALEAPLSGLPGLPE